VCVPWCVWAIVSLLLGRNVDSLFSFPFVLAIFTKFRNSFDFHLMRNVKYPLTLGNPVFSFVRSTFYPKMYLVYSLFHFH